MTPNITTLNFTLDTTAVVQLLVTSPSAGKVNQSGIAELRGVAGAGARS